MLESRILGALTTGIFAFTLSSSSAFAQEDHVGKSAGEAEAPTNCGVLGGCSDGEKVFMYSCEGDNVVIRHCGEGSRYKILNQKDCVGLDKKLSKGDFRSFIKAQLDKTELQGRLGPITRADIDAAKFDGSTQEAKACQEQIEGQITNLKNKLEQVGDLLSPAKRADIEGQIKSLEGSLGTAKAKVQACVNKDAAIKKIDDQIEGAVNTVCAKNGIHVPKSDSFLHTVLSQYDPSKHPCNSEKNCNQAVKLANGTVVGAVVSRSVNDKGVVEEYVIDKASKLTWSPEAPKRMNFKVAEAYCAAKKDLGLKWSIPSREEFRVAFNPSNPDKSERADNKNFSQALEFKNRLWSLPVGAAQYSTAYNSPAQRESVRCVGR